MDVQSGWQRDIDNNWGVTSVAWGDWEGDGDLDLAIGTKDIATRVYENENGKLLLGVVSEDEDYKGWKADEVGDTTAVAWGDWDGDDHLDLAVGGQSMPLQIYEYDGDTLLLEPEHGWGWRAGEVGDTIAIAWGDWDGDNNLNLAVAFRGEVDNYGYEDKLFIYENHTGTLKLDPIAGWGLKLSHNNTISSIAWGDWEGDGDLDLAVGSIYEVNQIYENYNGVLILDEAKSLGWKSLGYQMETRAIAWGDANGDGLLDLAIGNAGTELIPHSSQIYLQGIRSMSVWSIDGDDQNSYGVAWADWDSDGDLDFTEVNDSSLRIYENTRLGTNLLPNDLPSALLQLPYNIPQASYFSSINVSNQRLSLLLIQL